MVFLSRLSLDSLPAASSNLVADRLRELDDRIWTIRAASGQVDIQPGRARRRGRLRTTPKMLNALLDDP
jgi:hypothetical protein